VAFAGRFFVVKPEGNTTLARINTFICSNFRFIFLTLVYSILF